MAPFLNKDLKGVVKSFLVTLGIVIAVLGLSLPFCYERYGVALNWKLTTANVTNTSISSHESTYRCCIGEYERGKKCDTCIGTLWIGSAEIKGEWFNVTRTFYGPYEVELTLSRLWNGSVPIYQNPRNVSEWEFIRDSFPSHNLGTCWLPFAFSTSAIGLSFLFALCVGLVLVRRSRIKDETEIELESLKSDPSS